MTSMRFGKISEDPTARVEENPMILIFFDGREIGRLPDGATLEAVKAVINAN